MARSLMLAICIAGFLSEGSQASSLRHLRSSVFKIKVVSQTPQTKQPWLLTRPSHSNGSGFYIGNRQILTNAHVVANAKFISVLRDGDAEAKPAYVVHMAHDSDLAIISTYDESYLDQLPALTLGGVPRLQTPVAAIGYPTGGEQVSITQGVVSRIDYRRYAHSGHHEHLLIQVDSAINPGNSGGPVVQGRRVIGVAFQGHTSAENTGYVIPTPVIKRFLKDIESGHYDGHPQAGLSVSTDVMINTGTYRYHGLSAPVGVKVNHVAAYSPFVNVLNAGDVLTSIAGQEIGVDGKIDYQGERISFLALFDLRLQGDHIAIEYIRGQERLQNVVQVTHAKPVYDQSTQFSRYPRYLVHAGLVFIGLSRNYLTTWGRHWYRDAPLHLRFRHFYADFISREESKREWIVYAGRLAAPVNTYARGQEHGILHQVNGVVVKDLDHLHQLLSSGHGEAQRFDFEDDLPPIILSSEAAKLSHLSINQRYGVEPPFWLNGPDWDGAIGKGESH